MSHTFLLEIGLEEIPAHVVTPSVNQLVEKTKAFLDAQRLAYGEILPYSTPRRLGLKIVDLADKQADIEEEAKGPAKKIALDDAGNWSKAAQGFCRGQGVSVDDLFFKEIKGVEYVYVKKFIAGQLAKDVLQGIKEVIMSIKFQTMMRWASYDFEYVRPLRWLVALLDNEVVEFNILNVASGRVSQGHRFLGQTVTLNDANEYPESLLPQKVIADAKERKDLIVTQIKDLAARNAWNVDIDEDLLEEVNNLVEYPTVFAGSFDEKYLEVPDEVLITSMKDHQRFFYVTDQNGQMLPNFISVRNGNEDYLENVIAGNEKVLTARLEDAKFFYHEDQQQTIAHYVERLKKVTFHDKIGTIYEKMQRVAKISAFLGEYLGLSSAELADLARAAEIYKFDLVTGMVGEFAELQGIMGEIYANLANENKAVAIAMREEYMPTSAEGQLPETNVGAVLSIADKLDSIQAFFSADMIPTGSNDPYALRRQALGIVRITLDKGWNLSTTLLQRAIEQAASQVPELYENIDPAKHQEERAAFIVDRLEQLLSNENLRHDVISATTAVKDNPFVQSKQASEVLSQHLADADFKETIEALTRVTRLAKKAPEFCDCEEVDGALFENQAEINLNKAVDEVLANYAKQNVVQKYEALHSLKEPISAYFEQTMVMADDEAIKNNRLLQLSIIADLTRVFGCLEELNVK